MRNAQHMPLFVITASRLRDGAIVWRLASGSWSERFADAAPIEEAAVAAALDDAGADIRAQRVVGVYKVAVTATAAGLAPVSVRETIRAQGPSVRPDFAYTPHASGIGA
jgi:hypothetical protein